MKYLKASIILFAALLLNSCIAQKNVRPNLSKGFLDISSWNFRKDGLVSLNGEWEFYWNSLLEPKDFRSGVVPEPEYVIVPFCWSKHVDGQSTYPDFGYATYRLRIKSPPDQKTYAFNFSKIYSSARVWINGSLSFENGKVGTSAESAIPKFFKRRIVDDQDLFIKSDTIEVIIQVSDFSMGGPYSGLVRRVYFGPINRIYNEETNRFALNAGLVGVLLLISLYHFFLFLYRRREYSYLVFSLLSIIVASRPIFTSGGLNNYFSYLGYYKVSFLPIILYPPLILLFFYFLYKEEVHKKLVYAAFVISLLFLPFVFTSSAHSLNDLEPFSAVFALAIVVYLLFYSLIKAMINKRQGAIFAFLGTCILLIANVHDALYSQGKIYGFGLYVSEIGFGLYIIMQSLILAEGFSRSFKKNIALNKRLNSQNKNLEKIVDQRTQELKQRNEEIMTQNEALNQKNQQITDSINYAQRIQTALLPNDNSIRELLTNYFILYKPKDIVSGDFYWIKQINQYLIIVAADCTGHGVPGALMSMIGISYLSEIVQRQEVTQANQVLNELSSRFKHSLGQTGHIDEPKDGMDIALCVIDTSNRMMQFAGAYNPLFIIKDKNGNPEFIEIDADHMPVGYYHGQPKSFTNHEIQLEKGDLVYIFTDGYIDQIKGGECKKFMKKNFKALLLEVWKQPLDFQKEYLETTLDKWINGSTQTDDILIIGLRIK